MQESRTPLSPGRSVLARDERWTVVALQQFADAGVVSLRGAEPANRDEVRALLTPADRIACAPVHDRLGQRSRRAVLRAALSAIHDAVSWRDHWTAAHARIDLRTWQLEPARAAVSGAMRILLADEVGLGKTIQAALILAELRARGLAERALVLTPASIRDQWAEELGGRFPFDPVVFDQPTLATTAARLPPDVNPWLTAPLVISSIDLVKRPEVRAALGAAPLDVLIVDEAHHLAPGTDRAAVVAELARRTPWVVMATATPHAGDDDAFAFLRRVGDVGSEDVLTFRRSRAAVAGAGPRRSRLLFVRPTAAERALLDATSDYARALTRGRGGRGRRLVASVVSRRAASSAAAVHGTLTRRIALLSADAQPDRQALLPWEEEDGDAVSDAVLSTAGLPDVAHEVAWLERLARLACAAGTESSKVAVVRRLLRRTHEPLLVFSEFRDVAVQVASSLADLCRVAVLHGGLAARERQRAVRAFNSGAVRVLVATDAAGEGLNLQARCRLVVNIELPWTPRRLEQRTGRVDRIGQHRRVHALHLAHRDSYEATVIARLERRRARAAHAERLLAGSGVDAAGATNPDQRSDGPSAMGEAGAVYASRPATPCAGVVLVCRVTLADCGGRPVQQCVLARRIAGVVLPGRRLTRAMVRRLWASPTLRDTLTPEIEALSAAARDTTSRAADAIGRRLAALMAHLARLDEGHAWQASLFDRRAEQRARAGRRCLAALQAHLRHREGTARMLEQVAAFEPQLVAAWLE